MLKIIEDLEFSEDEALEIERSCIENAAEQVICEMINVLRQRNKIVTFEMTRLVLERVEEILADQALGGVG